jgi:periplasmic copper chaperone A
MRRARACAVLLVALLAACVRNDAPLRVSDAWLRALPDGATTTAAYMTIENRSSENHRVTAFSSPQFARAELHETRMEDGMARMRPVEALELGAGERVALEPGGLHLMLYDPVAPLAPNARVILRLQLDDGWVFEVEAGVRAP